MKKVLVLFLLLLFQYNTTNVLHAKSPIKIGIYENEPLIYTDTEGNGKGFFADIIEYIAQQERLQFKYVPGTWQQCLSRLEKNQIDILCVIAFSKERDKLYDFNTENLLTNWGQLYTSTESDIREITDVEGKKIAVLKNDIHYKIFKQNINSFGIKCEIIETDDYHSVFTLIASNKADAGVVNRFFGMKYGGQYHVDKSGIIFNPIKIHFAVPEGQNKDLISLIDKHISLLKKDESSLYYQSLDKWFGTISGSSKFPIWFKWAILTVIGPLFVLFLGNIILRKQVKTKTKDLTFELKRRKKAELTLQEQERHYHRLFNLLPYGAEVIDTNGNIIDCNPNTLKMLGYKRDELIGSHITKIFPNDSIKIFKKKFASIMKGNIEQADMKMMCKDGSQIEIIRIGQPIFDAKKNITSILAVNMDVTKRKLAEEEKEKAQKIIAEQKKLALVGQIAGKMAHDFNNVLGIIMGNTELSLLDCKEVETKKTLELIFEQTLRGKNLTKNLVAFAKDQEPKQEFFRLNEKIDLVLNLMRKDLNGIELLKEESPDIPEILADPGMIEHAFVNLVQNSIHATSVVENPIINIKTYCLNDTICFEIEDNGCGIPKKHLENIFDPSFTLKGTKDVTNSYETGIQGTGYGMANVKKYIKLHKGTISVESGFNLGTKFTINLPVIKKELTKIEKTEIRKEKIIIDKYILLVEDEQAISDVQYRILTQDPCNHKVDTANNGQIAMDLFTRNQYDLISLDYVLPGKINGMDLYNHIRVKNKTIPVLFISGNIEFLESIKELKKKDPNINHLSKPCQNKDYVTGINKLLTRATPSL